jgi:hypothetical protein
LPTAFGVLVDFEASTGFQLFSAGGETLTSP